MYQVHSFTSKKETTGENKAEQDIWHETVRVTDRKVPVREKASKTIVNIDLATVINPQTRLKKATKRKETSDRNKRSETT